MPNQIYPPEVSDAELLQELMGRVHAYLPLLGREEISDLLQALKHNAEEELDDISAFTRRESELLASIPSSDYSSLCLIHEKLNALEMERFLRFYSVPALHENCTAYRDALAARAVELVRQEMPGPPPLPFALISMGSDGREEQTLITDQDYLIVYGDDEESQEVAHYFRDFSLILVERLAEIGFKKCTGDIMPSNDKWRGSLSQWQRRLLSVVRYEAEDYGKTVMDLIVISDARYVAGDRELADELIGRIRTLEQDYFQALWGMAKAATEMKLALGFLKKLWTEGSGEHKGEFNLKLLAWAPLVMNVRILAINQGIPTTSTVKRIELLEREKSFSPNTARGLIEAYRILTKHRILLQIKVIKGIQNDAYYLNPYALPTEEREKIRHALLLIEDLQKIIHTNFSIM